MMVSVPVEQKISALTASPEVAAAARDTTADSGSTLDSELSISLGVGHRPLQEWSHDSTATVEMGSSMQKLEPSSGDRVVAVSQAEAAGMILRHGPRRTSPGRAAAREIHRASDFARIGLASAERGFGRPAPAPEPPRTGDSATPALHTPSTPTVGRCEDTGGVALAQAPTRSSAVVDPISAARATAVSEGLRDPQVHTPRPA